MALLTASEVTLYSSISASNATIVASGKIELVMERLPIILNNYFCSNIEITDCLTFNATARSILSVGNNKWIDYGFAAGDTIYLYNCNRPANNGYKDTLSISDETIILATGQTVVDELSGASIYVSVAYWPLDVKEIASLMVAFDYDIRPTKAANVRSRSLGPWSESYESGSEGMFGYPAELLSRLDHYRCVRLM